MAVDYATAALAAARRYCGWVVTPPETVTITVDGPGGRVLSLPTLQLTALTSITEDDVALDAADLRVSVNRGLVYKKSGQCWTCNAGGIQVTMTHGFAEAYDFDAAVEGLASALSSNVSGRGGDAALTSKKVDDVEYQWSVSLLQAGAIAGPTASLLAPYRILPSP